MYQENLNRNFVILILNKKSISLPIQLTIERQKPFFDGATINLRVISNVNHALPLKDMMKKEQIYSLLKTYKSIQ